jgi:hypothetical protein
MSHLAQLLLACGGAIFVLLGFLHALYTFLDLRKPRRLVPDTPEVREAMEGSTLRLTRGATTMWNAWVGFNFSHSLGAMMFGAGCMAVGHLPDRIGLPPAALLIPIAVGALYVLLAARYWFRIPLIGTALATAFFVLAWMASIAAAP